MNTNPKAKRILCFGDSNTWGYSPGTNHERIPADARWTGVLQNTLGNEYEIIEEGLNSRTINTEDPRPDKEGRNGKIYLIPCLDSHDPIDLVILMLGTNELKDRYNTTAEEIGKLIENNYVKIISSRQSQFRKTAPKLILIAPPVLDTEKEYAYQRYAGAKDKSLMLAKIYEAIANRNNCLYINSSDIVKLGDDGVHFDEANHRIFGEKLAEIIKSITL